MSDTTVAERPGRAGEPRAEKVAVVDEVRERLSSAGAAILTEYRGLKVSELETLRRALAQAGGDYKVYKNTLVRFAARDLGIDGIEALLEGPTAIAFATADVPGVAKALRDFSRGNPLLVVKGGLMGTSVLSAADAAALAEIPPREVLLGRMAGMFAAPLQQLAGLIQALPRNFAYGLQALIDQRGGAPEASSADASPPAGDAVPAGDAAPAEAAGAAGDAEAAAPAQPAEAAAPADAAEAAPSDAVEAPAPAAAAAEAASPENDQPTPAEPSAEQTEGAD